MGDEEGMRWVVGLVGMLEMGRFLVCFGSLQEYPFSFCRRSGG